MYADDANILAGSIHTIKKKNTEDLVVASKEIGLEVSISGCRTKSQYKY